MNSFKFFHGISIDIESELIRMMSEQISREIDEDILYRLTREINGGFNPQFEGPIIGFNNNRA